MDQPDLSKTSGLFPIGQLFSESWNTFTKSILQLLFLQILTIIIYVILGIAAVAIVIMSGIGSAVLQKGLPGLAQLGPGGWTNLGIIGGLFLLIATVVNSALGITSVLIVNDNGQSALGAKFKKSFGYVIPIFLISLVITFLILGGYFLFFIPGIVIAILLAFAQFEVVLSNQKSLFALRRSAAIVGKNFGGIFVRLLLLVLIYIGINIITSILKNLVGDSGKGLVEILSFIINVGLGWFFLAFIVNLYKQARTTISDNQVSNIVWIWIVAILGWLMVILIGFATWKVLSSGLMKELTPKTQAPLAASMQNAVTQMSPAAKVHFDKSAELFKQIQANKNDPIAVKKLNDENIAELKLATVLDSNNPQIWFELGNAYTWISTSGTWDDTLAAYQKAATLDPQNTIYIDNVADTLTSMGRYDEAVLQLQTSLRIAQSKGMGESGLTDYRLGRAYMGLKIYDSAKEDLTKAVEILSKENQDGSFDSYILAAQKQLSSIPK